jgi:flagellar biosynthesis/type III secretory pathway ATPase
VLSRRLAERAHWPAIDVPASLSRTMNSMVKPEHRKAADGIRRLLAAYRDAEDLIALGAYPAGSDPVIDRAMRLREPISALLCQRPDEYTPYDETIERLVRLDATPSTRPAAPGEAAA